jgi:hypothetical protein
MNTEKSLYIRALLWASDRGSVGFTMDELRATVTEDEGEWLWVQRMLLGEINGDPPLIFHLGTHNNSTEWRYYLTGSGAARVLDYLELKEARGSSKKATYIAIGSLSIAILVGIAQIVIQICYK